MIARWLKPTKRIRRLRNVRKDVVPIAIQIEVHRTGKVVHDGPEMLVLTGDLANGPKVRVVVVRKGIPRCVRVMEVHEDHDERVTHLISHAETEKGIVRMIGLAIVARDRTDRMVVDPMVRRRVVVDLALEVRSVREAQTLVHRAVIVARIGPTRVRHVIDDQKVAIVVRKQVHPAMNVVENVRKLAMVNEAVQGATWVHVTNAAPVEVTLVHTHVVRKVVVRDDLSSAHPEVVAPVVQSSARWHVVQKAADQDVLKVGSSPIADSRLKDGATIAKQNLAVGIIDLSFLRHEVVVSVVLSLVPTLVDQNIVVQVGQNIGSIIQNIGQTIIAPISVVVVMDLNLVDSISMLADQDLVLIEAMVPVVPSLVPTHVGRNIVDQVVPNIVSTTQNIVQTVIAPTSMVVVMVPNLVDSMPMLADRDLVLIAVMVSVAPSLVPTHADQNIVVQVGQNIGSIVQNIVQTIIAPTSMVVAMVPNLVGSMHMLADQDLVLIAVMVPVAPSLGLTHVDLNIVDQVVRIIGSIIQNIVQTVIAPTFMAVVMVPNLVDSMLMLADQDLVLIAVMVPVAPSLGLTHVVQNIVDQVVRNLDSINRNIVVMTVAPISRVAVMATTLFPHVDMVPAAPVLDRQTTAPNTVARVVRTGEWQDRLLIAETTTVLGPMIVIASIRPARPVADVVSEHPSLVRRVANVDRVDPNLDLHIEDQAETKARDTIVAPNPDHRATMDRVVRVPGAMMITAHPLAHRVEKVVRPI